MHGNAKGERAAPARRREFDKYSQHRVIDAVEPGCRSSSAEAAREVGLGTVLFGASHRGSLSLIFVNSLHIQRDFNKHFQTNWMRKGDP